MEAPVASTRPRWFQFTISRVLWATFWMGICFAAFNLSQSYRAPDMLLTIAIAVTTVLSPFVAVGTLLGHPIRGLFAGIVLVPCCVLMLYVAINNNWITPDF